MAQQPLDWPLRARPSENSRVVLATQGLRLWTAECHADSYDDGLLLSCSDDPTLANLRRQSRVSFTILGPESECVAQGSGLAHIVGETAAGTAQIKLEAYRLRVGTGQTYELRFGGWIEVVDTPASKIDTLAFWYQAFRGVTLPLSALPVLLGAAGAFAQGRLDPVLLVLALIGGVLAHAGANAFSDFFDFKKGVDMPRALSSHLGALARERVEPEIILLAAFACFAVTALIGIILVQQTGWPLLLFGVAGLVGAFSYTGWPLSYKYRSMGEPLLGILMGPTMVMGSYFVQTREWDWAVFFLSLSLAALVSSVSLVNNLRDLPDDEASGIRTLPMTLGVFGTKALYYVLTGAPYLFALCAVLLNPALWPVVVTVASLPQAMVAIKAIRGTADEVQDIRRKASQQPYPLHSIRLHARFGTLAVIGLVLVGLRPLFFGG